MSLLSAVLGRDKEQLRAVTRDIAAAVRENQIAASRLIEAIELRMTLTAREEEHSRRIHDALAHKQRRFRGGFP